MGLAFPGDLARKRSLASAALPFLALVDEIESLIFLAVGVAVTRIDLFLSAQNALFPAIVLVAAALILVVRNWRGRMKMALQDPIEMLDAAMLAARIGTLRLAPASAAVGGGAATSPYELSHGRTSQPGSR